jgi:hypothetical protein
MAGLTQKCSGYAGRAYVRKRLHLFILAGQVQSVTIHIGPHCHDGLGSPRATLEVSGLHLTVLRVDAGAGRTF